MLAIAGHLPVGDTSVYLPRAMIFLFSRKVLGTATSPGESVGIPDFAPFSRGEGISYLPPVWLMHSDRKAMERFAVARSG